MENKLREQLYNLATKGLENAYAPYSNYPVGAGLITKDKKAFIGSNIENAAFGSSLCAERVCVCSAYSNGVKKEDIEIFGLVTNSKEPATPCGACLQVLSELLDEETPIIIFNTHGDYIETNVKSLLPYAFTDQDLTNV